MKSHPGDIALKTFVNHAEPDPQRLLNDYIKAIKRDDVGQIELLQQHADISDKGLNFLIFHHHKYNFAFYKFHGHTSRTTYVTTPLGLAVEHGAVGTVAYFLEIGCHVNPTSADRHVIKPIHLIDLEDVNALAVLQLLLNSGAHPNDRPSLLAQAARTGNLEMVRLLLAHGATHVRASDPQAQSPLAAAKTPEIMLALLEAGHFYFNDSEREKFLPSLKKCLSEHILTKERRILATIFSPPPVSPPSESEQNLLKQIFVEMKTGLFAPSILRKGTTLNRLYDAYGEESKKEAGEQRFTAQ